METEQRTLRYTYATEVYEEFESPTQTGHIQLQWPFLELDSLVLLNWH